MPRLLLVSLAACLLIGCQPAAPPATLPRAAPHDTSAAEIAVCRALGSPGTALTAGLDTAPPTVQADRRYDLSVSEGGGFVRFVAPKAAEWTLYADGALKLVLVRDESGEIVPLVERGGGGTCAAATESRIYLLKAGAYQFEFDGPLKAAIVVTETHP